MTRALVRALRDVLFDADTGGLRRPAVSPAPRRTETEAREAAAEALLARVPVAQGAAAGRIYAVLDWIAYPDCTRLLLWTLLEALAVMLFPEFAASSRV